MCYVDSKVGQVLFIFGGVLLKMHGADGSKKRAYRITTKVSSKKKLIDIC